MLLSDEASDVRDSAEKVKRALQEAERAQAAASGAIRQATADIQSTNDLLTSVGTAHPGAGAAWRSLTSRRRDVSVCAVFRCSRRRRTQS